MGAAPRTGTGRRKPVRTDSLTSWNGMPRLMSITPEKKRDSHIWEYCRIQKVNCVWKAHVWMPRRARRTCSRCQGA